MDSDNIFIKTPLVYSKPLSDIASREIYLKLENTQPSGSFKLRGLSHICKEKLKTGTTSFVGSSGGNAGLALAYSTWKLKAPCKIFVPKFVNQRMLAKLKSYGAEIITEGRNWMEANNKALEELKTNEDATYIHPYDDPLLWEGHSKMVEEIKEDLPKGTKPGCIVVSVGGGGLLLGVMKGMENCGWTDVPILAMETLGSDCFYQSIMAGKLVEFVPTSIAKSLCPGTVSLALLKKLPDFNLIPIVVEDKEAVRGSIRLADDHGFMVEPSCGVTMASVYSQILPDVLENNGYNSRSGPIVLIVCGGSDVSPQILDNFAEMFHLNEEEQTATKN